MGTAKFHTDKGDVSSFSKQEKNCETKLHANEVFATNNMIISADLGQVQLSYLALVILSNRTRCQGYQVLCELHELGPFQTPHETLFMSPT